VLVDALLFVKIAMFASVVPLLARLPIRRLQRLVEPSAQRRTQPLEREEEARIIRHTETVCRLGRRFIKRRCMTRGLTLYFFLRRTGADVSLVFGAGEIEESFEGHCWLERKGEPFLEATDPRPHFTPMYAFDRAVPHNSKNAVDALQA
jgi:hypothetical protein